MTAFDAGTMRYASWACSARRRLPRTLRLPSARHSRRCRIASAGEAPFASTIWSFHPARTIQVATIRRVRTKALSGRRLKVVVEPLGRLVVGRIPTSSGGSYISDLHRAVLDAADRPRLVGGVAVLAEAVAAAAPDLKPDILIDYASRLGYGAALRRLGSLADALALHPLAGALEPIKRITADLDLEPGSDDSAAWRDKRWRVRWLRTVDELRAVVGQ